MKKGSKLKRLCGLFILLFMAGAIIVTYVGLKKKCEDLIKQKIIVGEELKKQKSKKNILYAQYQNLSSEERIVTIAVYEMGMIIADPPISVITISSEKVAEMQTSLQGQYE